MGLSKHWKEFLELLNSRGVGSDEALRLKFPQNLTEPPVFVPGKDALIRNKRAIARLRDLADIDTLEN